MGELPLILGQDTHPRTCQARDELKQGTGVRGLEVEADPAHRRWGLGPVQGLLGGRGEAEIRGKGMEGMTS